MNTDQYSTGTGLLSRVHGFMITPLDTSPRDLILAAAALAIASFLWTRVLRVIGELT